MAHSWTQFWRKLWLVKERHTDWGQQVKGSLWTQSRESLWANNGEIRDSMPLATLILLHLSLWPFCLSFRCSALFWITICIILCYVQHCKAGVMWPIVCVCMGGGREERSGYPIPCKYIWASPKGFEMCFEKWCHWSNGHLLSSWGHAPENVLNVSAGLEETQNFTDNQSPLW